MLCIRRTKPCQTHGLGEKPLYLSELAASCVHPTSYI